VNNKLEIFPVGDHLEARLEAGGTHTWRTLIARAGVQGDTLSLYYTQQAPDAPADRHYRPGMVLLQLSRQPGSGTLATRWRGFVPAAGVTAAPHLCFTRSSPPLSPPWPPAPAGTSPAPPHP
jgi:hypothetical protein